MRRLLSTCRRFLSDRRGNIAILFGLAVVPIFGMMGVALDYSMANMQRTALQAAADNTLLALSRMPQPMSDTDLQSYGTKIFKANLGSTPLQYDITNQANFNLRAGANGKLILDLHTDYPLTLGEVMSKFYGSSPKLAVGVHSEVQWGNTRLRVALVLDNSISMNDSGKMAALKTATKNLLTTLKGVAKSPEDVYVSIIPFSTNVNVGSANYNHSEWIDFTEWDKNYGSCSVSGKKPKSTCESSGSCTVSGKTSQSSCTSAGNCSISGNTSRNNCESAHACSISGNNNQNACQSARACSINPSQNNTQNRCNNAGGTWLAGVWAAGVWTQGVWTAGTWTPANHNTWNGCVIDRGLSSSNPDNAPGLDQRIDGLTSANNTKWQADAEDSHNCPVAITPLTNNWSGMTTTVTNMDVAYSTNQPIGLVWGWQTLRGGGPMGTVPAKDSNYAYSDTIILMSDGLNTMNRWNTTMPSNTNVSLAAVDKRMYDNSGTTGTCKYVKDDKIQIFTVQVNTGGDATSTLLKNCASNTSMFFELKSATALITTFDQIGSALANIHLSQ